MLEVLADSALQRSSQAFSYGIGQLAPVDCSAFKAPFSDPSRVNGEIDTPRCANALFAEDNKD